MRRRQITWFLAATVLIAACSRPASQAPAESTPSPTETVPAPSGHVKTEPGRPAVGVTARGGWRLIAEGAQPQVLHVAPDGSGMAVSFGGAIGIVEGLNGPGAPIMTDLEVEEISVSVGANPVTFKIGRMPWGPRLLEPRPEIALSPDGTSASVNQDGAIWVVDLAARTARRATSAPPERPPNLLKHAYWEWATAPSWSTDGQWIYFRSTRTRPNETTIWRVPAAGGTEELVPDAATERKLPQGMDSISPGRRWAVSIPERGKLHLTNMASGHLRVLTLPPGAVADAGTVHWSPDESRLLLQMRVNGYEIAGLMAVIETATGEVRYLSHPDPARDHISPLGWLGNDRIMVRMQPWDQSQYIFPQDRAESQLWVLDLKQYEEPQPQEPGKLLAARLAGLHGWTQTAASGVVTGGEVVVTGESAVLLRFDRPISADWLTRHVEVEGAGAALQVHGAPLGIASVPLPPGRAGEDVRIRVPKLNFSLRVRRVEKPRVAMEIRTQGGSCQHALDERVFPPGPLEVKLTFSRSMKKATVEAQIREQLPPDATLQWEGTNLLIRIPAPAQVTRFVLSAAQDELGLPMDLPGLPAIRAGEPPWLVAATEQGDVKVRKVVPEITDAVISEDRESLRFTRYLFAGGDPWSAYHLSPWQKLNLRTGEVSSEPINRAVRHEDLVIQTSRDNMVAGLLDTRWLGPEGGYLYEVSLVLRDGAGREIKRSEPVKAFYPPTISMSGALADTAWAPDGKQIAFTVTRDRQDYTAYLYEVASGALRELAGGLPGPLLRWSPDGRRLIAGRTVLDANTGRALATLNGTAHLSWSPGGDMLLYNLAEWGAVEVLDLEKGDVRSAGTGLPVGWDLEGRPLVIRWEGSARRWIPHGE